MWQFLPMETLPYKLDIAGGEVWLDFGQCAGMNPLIGLIVVLAVEVADGSGEAVHGRLMQPLRRAYVDPVACDGIAVNGIAVLRQIGDQVAADVAGLVTHLLAKTSRIWGEKR